MALSILDGNQSATTLSTILSSGQHITAHTVVSLGTQAITDMRGAVSGSVVSVSSLPAISGTVTANLPQDAAWAGIYDSGNDCIKIELANLNGDTISPSNPLPISGTVTANLDNVVTTNSFWDTPAIKITGGDGYGIDIAGIDGNYGRAIFQEGGGIPVYPRDNADYNAPFPVAGTVTANLDPNSSVISSQIESGIGSYAADLANDPFPISGTVTIGSLPAISGTVTANTFALQGTAVTTSNFTSTTASTVLASFNATREVLTIFNEGAGNLHICAGATCTTIAYQVRLSSGDYYEVPNHQTSLTHSAVFATAGTASVTEVS